MKRMLSVALILSMLFGMMGAFTGCGIEKLMMGQWLEMINDTFEMRNYATETPYFSNVGTGHEYYSAVQIAGDWQVIDTTEDTIDIEGEITGKVVAVTLVNTAGFVYSNADEEEKMQYAEENFFEDAGKKRDKAMTEEEAAEILAVAHQQWVDLTFDETIEEVDFADDVVDLTDEEDGVTDYTLDEGGIGGSGSGSGGTGGTDFNEGTEGPAGQGGSTTTMSASDAEKLSEGDVYVLPPNEENKATSVNKVESITIDGDKAIIKNSDEELDFSDFAETIYVQETVTPNFMEADIYDGNGVKVQTGTSAQTLSSASEPQISNLALAGGEDLPLQSLASGSFSFTTSRGDEISVKITDSSVTATIKALISGSKTSSEKMFATYSFKLNNFKVTHQTDYSGLKLNSALAKVDYDTSQSWGLSWSNKIKPSDQDGLLSTLGTFLEDMKQNVANKVQSGEPLSFTICTVKVVSAALASIDIDIKAELGLNGSINITCSEAGSKGIEYKNNSVRLINESVKKLGQEIKGSAELVGVLEPNIKILTKSIIGFNAKIGLGASLTSKMYLVDEERHLLEMTEVSDGGPENYAGAADLQLSTTPDEIHKIAQQQGGVYTNAASSVKLSVENAVDIKLYFILRVALSKSCLVGSLMDKIGVKVEFEIFGANNTPIATLNIIDFKFDLLQVGVSSKQFTPFDQAEEESSEETISSEVPEESSKELGRGVLSLSASRINLDIREQGALAVSRLPEGYEMSDIQYLSGNTDIATVDANGVVIGVSEGTTIVRAYTSDNQFSAQCTINVSADYDVDFQPLD